jgi:hypothetical protein
MENIDVKNGRHMLIEEREILKGFLKLGEERDSFKRKRKEDNSKTIMYETIETV